MYLICVSTEHLRQDLRRRLYEANSATCHRQYVVVAWPPGDADQGPSQGYTRWIGCNIAAPAIIKAASDASSVVSSFVEY